MDTQDLVRAAVGLSRCICPTDTTQDRFGGPLCFSEGLYELPSGDCYAWLSPNGDWGAVNTGLVKGKRAALLIDTLWDMPHTLQMLQAMERLTACSPIRFIVNTHGDGDHFWGNGAVADAEIITSTAARETMVAEPRDLMRFRRLGRILSCLRVWGCRRIGHWFSQSMAPYDFRGLQLCRPTRTFEGVLTLDVGGRNVRLIEIRDAHSVSDVMVEVPDARVLYAGDVIFCGVTPLSWVSNPRQMINALEQVLAMQVDVVVPGHGSLTDKTGVEKVLNYWRYLDDRIYSCFEAGQSVWQAAETIVLSEHFSAQLFNEWSSPEYSIINISTAYRHLRGLRRKRSDFEWLLDMSRAALFAHRCACKRPQALRC